MNNIKKKIIRGGLYALVLASGFTLLKTIDHFDKVREARENAEFFATDDAMTRAQKIIDSIGCGQDFLNYMGVNYKLADSEKVDLTISMVGVYIGVEKLGASFGEYRGFTDRSKLENYIASHKSNSTK